MKLFFTFQLCLLLAAVSHAALQDESEEPPSSHIGALKSSFSALSQSGRSWMNAQKENIGESKQIISVEIPGSLHSTIDEAYKVNYTELLKQVNDWITEHPYQTTFYFFNGVVFFYPGLITGPALWRLGWTSIGPRAGSPAAALMARFGTIPSRGVLATLESAGMGGYGSALVQGGTRAVSAALPSFRLANSLWQGAESSRAKVVLEAKNHRRPRWKLMRR